MAGISKVLETELNGLKVNLFEFDIENEESFDGIKAYLVNKVKISKVHNIEEYDLTYYGSKNLNPDFVARFNEQVAKINIPKKTKIPQFDVRRERVTEWMAQYLLEQEYGCKFYDEADKRVNLKTVEIDKHTDGIDVPGIWIDNDRIRFVVCEVKASEANQIPCYSVQSLQEIMFFPFLLRNNEKIVPEMDINDYKNFSLQGVKRENVENIILSFRKKFSEFSNEVYEEAIGE